MEKPHDKEGTTHNEGDNLPADPKSATETGGSKPPPTRWKRAWKSFSDFFTAHVGWPLLSGIAGLMVAVILLLGWPFAPSCRFHEIDAGLKAADQKSLSLLKKTIERSKTQEEAALKIARDNKDSLKIKATIDSLKKLEHKLLLRAFEQAYKTDTFAWNAGKLTIRPDLLDTMISKRYPPSSLVYGYYDPEISRDTFTISSPVSIKPYHYNMDFFRKYPAFAFWLFLGILQMVMWALMIPISLSAFNSIGKLQKLSGTINRLGKSFILAGIALVIFCVFLYWDIIDDYVFDDRHFMQGFNGRIASYSVIGYAISLLCLAGYLYLTDSLSQLQEPFNKKSADLEVARKAKIQAAGTDAAALAAIETDPQIILLTAKKKTIEDQFNEAKTFFNLFLGMAALVLSMLIFWIASMFHAINSLEIFKYYRAVSGHNYAANDFIYLFGGLHSILLAIFVLPAKFKIMELNARFPKPAESPASSTSDFLKSLLKNMGATIREVLVVSSPLLASFLQNLFTSNT